MIIRVSELDEQGLRIDDVAALAPGLTEPSWRLEAVSLEVEADGSDVFVRGRVAVSVPQTCGRCAELFRAARRGRRGRQAGAAAGAGPTAWSWAPTISTWTSTQRSTRPDPHRRDGDQPGLADEAAVSERLPGPVSRVRGQPQRRIVRVRVATAGPASGRPARPRHAPVQLIAEDRRKEFRSCRYPNDGTRAREAASAARTTSCPRRRGRCVRSAGRPSSRIGSARTAATTRGVRSSPSKRYRVALLHFRAKRRRAEPVTP